MNEAAFDIKQMYLHWYPMKNALFSLPQSEKQSLIKKVSNPPEIRKRSNISWKVAKQKAQLNICVMCRGCYLLSVEHSV